MWLVLSKSVVFLEVHSWRTIRGQRGMLCRRLTVDVYACAGKDELELKKEQGPYLSGMLEAFSGLRILSSLDINRQGKLHDLRKIYPLSDYS